PLAVHQARFEYSEQSSKGCGGNDGGSGNNHNSMDTRMIIMISGKR
ncbi:12195_t:CDS:2, partial [Entrophospora sp. SA101]